MNSISNHSSSDKSYSPPASRTSTRDTTADFDPSVSTASETSGTRICDMEASNSFQARDNRYSGEMPLAAFRRYNHREQHHQQQQQQAPMRSFLANSNAMRSLDAPNWRMGLGIGNGPAQGHGHYHTLSSASGPEYMVMGTPFTERHSATDQGQELGADTLGFFAYCLDRGNGNYTRLIPADMLPPLVGIPAVQHGAENMLVLPAPRGLDPQNPSGGTIQPVAIKTPPPSPVPVSDALQKKIDHIVASSPVPSKKPKIYCDKWVHEGVCAFTQQGCKYKHEMPLDKATQHSLGLFHGLPTWWKKQQAELQQAELQRQQQQQQQQPPQEQEGRRCEAFYDTAQSHQAALPSPIRSEQDRSSPARASHSWRRVGDVKIQGRMGSMSPVKQGGGGYATSIEQRTAYQQGVDSPTSPCVWGPIGPPSKQSADHPQMYHQNLGGYGASTHFSMLENLGERGAGSRFDM